MRPDITRCVSRARLEMTTPDLEMTTREHPMYAHRRQPHVRNGSSLAAIEVGMASRDPSILAARWLVGVSAVVVAAFVFAALLAQDVQRAIVARSDELVTNAMPSIKMLSTVRGNLRAMVRELGRETKDAQQLAEVKASADSTLRDIDDEIANYKENPFFPRERELFAPLSDALDSLAVHYAAWKAAPGPTTLAAFLADVEIVDERLERVIGFDADQGVRLGLEIEQIRGGSMGLLVLVDGVAVLLAAGVVLLAARQLRRAARARKVESDARDKREAELRERNEALGQFAGRVAHDVLSPLATTMFAFDLLRQSCDQNKAAARAIDRGVAGLQRVQVLVDGLLGFSRAGGHPEPGETVELAPVLGDLIDGLQAQAQERNVALSLEPVPDGAVACSRGVLTSIATNLVRNAMKYMGDASDRRVTVDVRDAADKWRIEVSDTGPGIPEDQQHRIFEPYIQLGRSGGGIGLGLATVDRLVRAHSGAVGVRSRVGAGSTFWFEIPKVELAPRAVAVPALEPARA
jgi:signal transduction histidine kinase